MYKIKMLDVTLGYRKWESMCENNHKSIVVRNGSEEKDMVLKKEKEKALMELLKALPVLKKHGIEGEILSKVKTLRNGRKTKSYTLEMSRMYKGKEIKFDAPVLLSPTAKSSNNAKVLTELKEKIIKEIQKSRLDSRPKLEAYDFVQGVKTHKMGDGYCFTKEGIIMKVLGRKVRLDMKNNKSPKDNDNYVGIEIELASKKDREFIMDKLFDAGLGKNICIKGDGSITAGRGALEGYPHPHEVCVLARQSEFIDVVNRVCKVLNDQCEVKVDKSCGLHVHFDMRNRDVNKSFSNLVSCQNFLYSMIPAQRKHSNYSKPVKGKTFRQLDDRYYGINTEAYRKYKTLELRMHSGTTDAKKITGWASLILAIIDAPEISRAYSTVTGLKKAIGISDALAEYIKSRINKFAAQHKKGAPHTEVSPIELVEEDIVADVSVDEDSEAA